MFFSPSLCKPIHRTNSEILARERPLLDFLKRLAGRRWHKHHFSYIFQQYVSRPFKDILKCLLQKLWPFTWSWEWWYLKPFQSESKYWCKSDTSTIDIMSIFNQKFNYLTNSKFSTGLFQLGSHCPYMTIAETAFCCFLSLPGSCNCT